MNLLTEKPYTSSLITEKKVILNPYQDEFLFSEARYPCLKSGIGTGKTFMFLLKFWNFCKQYPDTLALIVRKEFTDLRDSTINDFQNYFGVTVNSHKEYDFANKSKIMFRHGAEMNVLKNINLTIFGVEQAEEFETDETFTFLRDRLRRDNAPIRQGVLIANANGHNWIYDKWFLNPPSKEYHGVKATTFDNKHNLPADFIKDLQDMEKESPSHYKRMVLNSDDDDSRDDALILTEWIQEAINKEIRLQNKHVLGIDVARYGNDETVVCDFDGYTAKFPIVKKGNSVTDTAGSVIEYMRDNPLLNDTMRKEFNDWQIFVDDVGVGGGLTDILRDQGYNVTGLIANSRPNDVVNYADLRTEMGWILREKFRMNQMSIPKEPKLLNQLSAIYYEHTMSGPKRLISKEKLRKEGIESPDWFDALAIACWGWKNGASPKRGNRIKAFDHMFAGGAGGY